MSDSAKQPTNSRLHGCRVDPLWLNCPTVPLPVWGQESGGHSSPEKRSYAACRVIPNERPMATHMAPNSVTFGTQ